MPPLLSRMLRPALLLAVLVLLAVPPARAQRPLQAPGGPARETPVMRTVFFNVFWGSATGALLGAASASMASPDKEAPVRLRETAITGASAGALFGLGVGVWLVFNGVTFDPNRSLLFGGGTLVDGRPVRPPTPPVVLETDPQNPGRVTGFKALVLDLRF